MILIIIVGRGEFEWPMWIVFSTVFLVAFSGVLLSAVELAAYGKLPEECIIRKGTQVSFFADNGWHDREIGEIINTEVFPATWQETVFLPLACHGLYYRSLRFSGSLKIKCSDGSVYEVKLLKDVADVNAKLKIASNSYN